MNEVNKKPKNVINDISKFIGNNPVHFSFDVDVLDPSVMPSTGTAVDDGIELEQCKKIIDYLFDCNLVSVDITELNLAIGHVEDRAKSLINLTYLFKRYIF